jgi:hypothetical protein
MEIPLYSRPDLTSCVRGCGSCFFFLQTAEPGIGRKVKPCFPGSEIPIAASAQSIADDLGSDDNEIGKHPESET